METKKEVDIQAWTLEEVFKEATLLDSIEDIFNIELSLPNYYDEKNFKRRWQTKNGKGHRFF